MKGHIFNLLEAFIEEIAGQEQLFDILDACSFDTESRFVRTENYPDEQLLEIVDHAVSALGISHEQAHYAFGKWLYARLITLLPPEFTDFPHPAPILKKLDDLHKVELKKLYPDAIPPSFDYIQHSPTQADLIYCSSRRMFTLVEGTLQGMAEHYGVGVTCKLVTPWEGDENKAKFELTFATPT
ncbi:heme NO-binding domain-containing protein [Pseudoalteromonas xiamenensis]|uniref:heme NO-binding domain-containing protein n=1 Tax=Pseudoalteromonas xiamenensis TaxID=882626 RepID=UPI0027E562E7|nr:heme NO-binding domain-containing protein [Pseudoalteromonas xiamenensis]WMN60599.1 heme NO-binding domain-containing protein [Pseudoalteromonas xiamenensis]